MAKNNIDYSNKIWLRTEIGGKGNVYWCLYSYITNIDLYIYIYTEPRSVCYEENNKRVSTETARKGLLFICILINYKTEQYIQEKEQQQTMENVCTEGVGFSMFYLFDYHFIDMTDWQNQYGT